MTSIATIIIAVVSIVSFFVFLFVWRLPSSANDRSHLEGMIGSLKSELERQNCTLKAFSRLLETMEKDFIRWQEVLRKVSNLSEAERAVFEDALRKKDTQMSELKNVINRLEDEKRDLRCSLNLNHTSPSDLHWKASLLETKFGDRASRID